MPLNHEINFTMLFKEDTNMLVKNNEMLHKEKEDIYRSGLRSSIYQQIDDTGTKVNGENYYTHVVCNELYAAYFTTKHKDRLTIIDILRGSGSRSYCFNEETFKLLKDFRISSKIIHELMLLERDKELSEDEINKTLDSLCNVKIGKTTRVRILESAAIASYRKETGEELVKILVCDDAPQFKLITDKIALCWIHEGRHYKKLAPVMPHNRQALDTFLKEYWGYYKKLLKYKDEATENMAMELDKEFDRLFATRTGYNDLDNRIRKTQAKKNELLTVLEYHGVPLHNNNSELQERAQVRFLDVSLQSKTEEGARAKDAFLTKDILLLIYHEIETSSRRVDLKKQIVEITKPIMEHASLQNVYELQAAISSRIINRFVNTIGWDSVSVDKRPVCAYDGNSPKSIFTETGVKSPYKGDIRLDIAFPGDSFFIQWVKSLQGAFKANVEHTYGTGIPNEEANRKIGENIQKIKV
ncbi:virulence factor SrfC family protein [Candidatus Magnetobacterium casense]|uniref:Transposase n=1 Tax=Candidatus Magnetobacterium casense TaxID=1455061 RepID=A0ABS6RW72_9BACT|nr:virulence factor SrfC family protein [Candidatus Magnetobacterium casensis]MBV6340877.1 transposase [Candidatus Magnetobacterium casensis]